jgi:FixJ family two-component response regulator
MPRITGPEVHDWLRQRNPEVPVIFLSGYADVPTAVRAMRQGAFDFLEKPFNVQQLIERVNAAVRLADQDARRAPPPPQPDGWRQALTPREQEILVAIVAGKRNKVIGAELGISERTVESHRATSWTRPAPAASSNWSAGSSRPADAALGAKSRPLSPAAPPPPSRYFH